MVQRIGLMSILRLALLGLAQAAWGADEAIPRPYLMLVTFSAPRIRSWTPETLNTLNASPFAGAASIVVGGYDTGPVPGASEFDAAVAAIKQGAKRDVWPWVFTNRFMGRGSGHSHTSAGKTAPEYFKRIKGWDLSNRAGAQGDFLKIWKLALVLAKKLGAPGIVLDLEAYNNYESYNLAKLAESEGLTEDAAAQKLRGLGRRMASVVAEEYPSAIIWSLFLQLGETMSVRHLTEGLLDEAKEKQIPLKLVEGGETTVGYYNPSINALRQRIRSRSEDMRPWMAKYPDHLRLGGTISPYHDPKKLQSWIKRRSEAGGHVYQSAREFRPLFEELSASCEYLWIYAASASGYGPFSEKCRPVWEPIHAELAALYPKWRAAYRLLPLPRAPRGSRPRERAREYHAMPVSTESWIKGDPNTDLKQGEVTLGLEDKVVRTSRQSLKFRIDVNWQEPKDSQYPVGWPMIRRAFEPRLDLRDYDLFEFWVNIHTTAKLPNAPLKYGLSNAGKEPLWQKVLTKQRDDWVRVQLPLDVLVERDKITRLTFYIAENWYRHGDVITFYIDGVRFLRQTTPEIRRVASAPWVVGPGDEAVRVECRLAGEVAGPEFGVEFFLSSRTSGKVMSKQLAAIVDRSASCTLPAAAWPPGAYECAARLMRRGAAIDEDKCIFAVVAE